ncbi:hypothetical protein DPMN_113701 [Dreissena polymorpha]|uniref:Uncharacterized protein n=1 Tax=Dreissena polymorpha TaxID=45954 RepID=A0A9D4QR24_DREPO|nr:hypothetical protein DPMN_113701 [Dreissena polymorpha]
MLIKAGRSGCWIMLLQTCVFPVFAADGYFHIMRSAYIYLQLISALHETHRLSKVIKSSFIVVTFFWSNQCLARLSSYLAIEQTLMRYNQHMLSQSNQNRWTLSAPVISDYNSAMQDLTVFASTQRKDSTEVHFKTDTSDLEKMQTTITTCSTYTTDPL